jgi:hypothetical protein
MSHFYSETQGHRGEASRGGTKSSGIWCNIRGWHIGCFVDMYYDTKRKRDMVRVYKTQGSSGTSERVLIAKYSERPSKRVKPVCYKSGMKGGE